MNLKLSIDESLNAEQMDNFDYNYKNDKKIIEDSNFYKSII